MIKELVKTFSIVCIILGFLIVLNKGFKIITNSYSTEKAEDAKQFDLYSVYFGVGLMLLGTIILVINRLFGGVKK